MPNEVAMKVSSFLPRSWWPDDRRRCWCHDCQLMELSTLFRDKVTARESSETPQQDKQRSNLSPASSNQKQIPATMHNVSLMRPLPTAQPKGPGSTDLLECKCGVILYCSSEHRKYLMQDYHRRMCGTPPFRPHGIDEELLCREVFAISRDDDMHGGDDSAEPENVEYSGNSDDESCWESVDSHDEHDYVVPKQKTKTELIHSFFDRKSYKVLEVERPALAGHVAVQL